MAAKILVVDDEPTITELLTSWLQEAGHEVLTAQDGLEGLKLFFNRVPDLVVIDVLMPQMDGLELCRRIREVSYVPVIFLSAKGEETDKALGLTLGGDDYVAKPVGRKEFLARVEALLRRSRMPPTSTRETIYSDETLTIDFARHEVKVRGAKVNFTPLEFKLLTYFVKEGGNTLNTDDILDKVWGPNYSAVENVKWYIAQLRRKIEEDPSNPRLLVNVRGVGYRYERPQRGAR